MNELEDKNSTSDALSEMRETARELMDSLEKMQSHFLMIVTRNEPSARYASDFNAAQAALARARAVLEG